MQVVFRRILVPVDGSIGAAHAARFAATLAAATGASITLLHVVAPASTAQTIGLAAQSREQLRNTLLEMAHPHLMRARDAIAAIEQPVQVQDVVELGDPAPEITGYAKKHAFDLIVMGSRGLTPLRELLMGSVSENVVRRASCPVTVVR